MSRQAHLANESPIPAQPMPDGAQAFSERVHGLLDGQPKDEAAVAQALEGMDDVVERIAAGLYNLASMLVGEGEDSVGLVETAVANAELSACDDPGRARQSGRRALCAEALELLARRTPGSLAAPQGVEPAATCIEDDDLDAAGVSTEELECMMAGADRERVRTWLASLSTEVRTVFVLRAVAGFTAAETAGLLAAHGGPRAAGWTADAVRAFFRQGLCSLASQLLQATVASH
jgi:DNA-directed RNA polymerase specialized sigma24 family protein